MLRSVEAHYRRQQRLTALAVVGARRVWAAVDESAVLDSWRGRVGDVVVLLAGVQRAAARDAIGYTAEALEEQGLDPTPVGTVPAAAFAGRASDGRPLDTLLEAPAYRALHRLARGDADALPAGQSVLDRLVATQVQDAARQAAGTSIVATPSADGWTRMLNPPSCSRCAVLAGAFYEWNRGFLRHPNCDCRHVPTSEKAAGDLRLDPRGYFDSLDAAQQDRIFTKAGAEAIRDGADVGRVVNARRGMDIAGNRGPRTQRFTTTARASRGRSIPTPEGIYANAASRTAAIDQLRRFGYIV